jgi:hypothetical protein
MWLLGGRAYLAWYRSASEIPETRMGWGRAGGLNAAARFLFVAAAERRVMPQTFDRSRRRILDPPARISEILFGVIMALTFTRAIDAASAGREDVRVLVFAAVGCNVAWGLVDAMMYLLGVLSERGRDLLTIQAVRAADSPDAARALIVDALPPIVARLLTADDLARLHRDLRALTNVPARPRIETADWLGAVGVFLLVCLATLPLVVPFVLIADVQTALLTSNAIALAIVFAAGYLLARYSGYRPLRTATIMVVLGCILVAVTIALGG